MAMTQTQTTLRLEMLTLEVHSLIDRTIPQRVLHEVADYCIPRRLLRCVHIYGMRNRQAFMRLDIEIDEQTQEQLLTLSGCGLPDGVAGAYSLGDCLARNGSPTSALLCPCVGKAVALFMATIKKRGLVPAWTLSFRDRHTELCQRFGLTGGEPFTDCTADRPASTVRHSVLSELSVSCREAPDPENSAKSDRQYQKRPS